MKTLLDAGCEENHIGTSPSAVRSPKRKSNSAKASKSSVSTGPRRKKKVSASTIADGESHVEPTQSSTQEAHIEIMQSGISKASEPKSTPVDVVTTGESQVETTQPGTAEATSPEPSRATTPMTTTTITVSQNELLPTAGLLEEPVADHERDPSNATEADICVQVKPS